MVYVLILIPRQTFLLFVDQIEDKLDKIITMHCKIIGETDTIWYHWVFSMYTVKAMFWSWFHDISLPFVLFVEQIEDRLTKIEDKLDKIIGESDTIECLARACMYTVKDIIMTVSVKQQHL